MKTPFLECAPRERTTSRKFVTFGCLAIMMVTLFLTLPAASEAQDGTLYRARLAPAPPLGFSRDNVAGSGQVWWSLDGTTLDLNGGFEHLASRATVARIHLGEMTAIRGDAVFDLEVETTSDGMSGTISGSVQLNREQIDALGDGRFYVQLYSEGTPDGHLQGWLLQ
jgi:hypothetical protein